MDQLPGVIEALKEACQKTDWWQYVQEDVSKALLHIMDNVAEVGRCFRDAFTSQLVYEHIVRVLLNETRPFSEPTVLFGGNFPEEFYLSGKNATKALLHLNDWVEPNEADVQACVVLCQQIDVLQTMGILSDQTPLTANFMMEFFSAAQKSQKPSKKS